MTTIEIFFLLSLIPLLTYLTVQAGTYGYLMAKRKFNHTYYPQGETDGKCQRTGKT